MSQIDEQPSSGIDAHLASKTEQQTAHAKKIILGCLAVLIIISLFYGLSTLIDSPDAVVSQQQRTSPNMQYSAAQLEENRARFISTVQNFEEIEGRVLQNAAIIDWRQSAVQNVYAIKEQALTSFASSAFIDALSLLQSASEEALALERQWHDEFERTISLAYAAFEKEQINQAKLALDDAQGIKPNDAKIEFLQSRIDAFDLVKDQIEALKVAQIENNVPAQINAIKAIMSLDPERSAYLSQLKNLESSQKEARISALLADGFQALNANNLALANSIYNQLQNLAPQRSPVKEMGQQLVVENKKHKRVVLQADIDSAKVNDQWPVIKALAQKGLQSYPSDTDLQQSLALATKINSLKAKIQDYLNRPKRLEDPNIQTQATQTLSEAVSVITQSASLSAQVKRLSDLLSSVQADLDLLILSDNKTSIKVLGVGIVGEVRQKLISLPPGTYTLEGRCAGFKTKQVNIDLLPSKTDNQITLVCDERI